MKIVYLIKRILSNVKKLWFNRFIEHRDDGKFSISRERNNRIIVLTAAYNCEKYIGKCLTTISKQKYNNFKCFVMDDISIDKTFEIAKNFENKDKRFTVIKNSKKHYPVGNYDQIINGNHGIRDDDIIVEVNGDDWLPDNETLDRIALEFLDRSVWFANGSFIYADGRKGFTKKPEDFSRIRESEFTASHIRAYKAFLWKNILSEDLRDEEGNYWSKAGDLAFGFPMLEMCGASHYKFMKEINYIYNDENPINEHKVGINEVNIIVNKIRSKKAYKPLIN